MKGMIFTEFMEMVEEVFSAEMVEHIIDDANLPNGGAYTDVGTYSHEEIVRLVVSLHKRTDIPLDTLLMTFGEYLFRKFVSRYHEFIADMTDVFDCLKKVDQHIHVEVLKLYPDADLPKFDCIQVSDHQLNMIYQSNHPFGSLAEGLINGCATHFKQKIAIKKTPLPPLIDKQHVIEFSITLQD